MTHGLAHGSSIAQIYATHPLSAASILKRIKLTKPHTVNVGEEDLAYDPAYGITD